MAESSVVSELPPRVARRYMNYLIASAVIWCFFGAANGGTIFSGLMNALHLTDPQIGLISAIGYLCLPLQLIGSLIQQKYFNRKKFWAFFVFIHYSSYLALALLAAFWTGIPATLAFGFFMLIMLVSSGAAQLTGAISSAWQGDVIPARESTAFWNRRSGFTLVAGMVAGLIAAQCADALGKDNRSTYVIMLSCGVIFGYLSMLAMLPIRDRDTRHDLIGGSVKEQIRTVLHNPQFRHITFFFAFQMLVGGLSSAFYTIYLLKDMNLSMTAIQILSIIGALMGLAAAFFFRIVGQRYGNKPVLILCTTMKAVEFTLCALWLPSFRIFDNFGNGILMKLAGLTHLPIPLMEAGFFTVLPSFMVAGFFNVGLGASQMALLTTTGPRQQRSTLIGIYNFVIGVVGFLVLSASGVMYQFLRHQDWLTNSRFTPYNVLALMTAIGYALSLFILRRFREDGAAGSTGAVFRTLITGNPIRTVYQAHTLSQPIAELSRIKKLQHIHSNLISEELVRDLYSPSSRVRDGALINLSTMEGEVSRELQTELIRLLDLPALGLQAMAARTIGRLRVKQAVPALMKHFQDPDLAISQACIFAAGLIGDTSADKALQQVLSDDRFHRRWPHAAEALSRLGTGDFHYTHEIFQVLANEGYWVLRQQTLISLARLMMHDKNAAYVVFDSETRLPGSEIERLMRQISLSPVWKTFLGDRKADFDTLIAAYDGSKYIDCIHHLLPLELALYGIEPDSPDQPAAEFLSVQFASGGMRERSLEAMTYQANNLWLQLKLWAELKYDTDGTDRFLLLLVLISAAELLPRRMRDNGRLDV